VSHPKLEISRDPGRIARALIERYGVAASSVARWKALHARSRADAGAMQAWQWVAGATDEILRAEPD
jgi:hypothetical protein